MKVSRQLCQKQKSSWLGTGTKQYTVFHPTHAFARGGPQLETTKVELVRVSKTEADRLAILTSMDAGEREQVQNM